MKKIIISIIILIVGIATFIAIDRGSVEIIKTISPLTLKTLSEPIVIPVSNKPYFLSAVSVTISPEVDGALVYDEFQKAIVFIPQSGETYDYGQSYIISVSYFGKALGEVNVVGPRKPIVPSLAQNDKDIAEYYPLASFLPYKTSDLKVDYIKPLTLRLTTQLSESEAISLTREYATSKNIDITNHKFVLKLPE